MASGIDEFDIIARYFAPLSEGAPGAFALTDDAAEFAIAQDRKAVVATDALVAGVHFPVDEDPTVIASRLIRVNLSDLAAMGATPRFYTLALALPEGTSEEWVEKFAQGLDEQQRQFAVTLVGGDTTRSDGSLMLSLTMIGEAHEKGSIQRSGAAIGDGVYVTGTIGDALLGRYLLIGDLSRDDVGSQRFLEERFRYPLPRVELGKLLVGVASAAADISDGLIADLGHICTASGVAAEVEFERIPLSSAAERLVTDDQPLRINLLSGGDDYELVFTAPKNASGPLQQIAQQCDVRVSQIGEIVERDGAPDIVTVRDADGQRIEVGNGGYRHFRRGRSG